jgi:aryl-alcohol dehydrogenase-like predicted oxidoreductase
MEFSSAWPLRPESIGSRPRNNDVRRQRCFRQDGVDGYRGARRQIDLCLDAGINLFDRADVYSAGLSEEILGQALKSRRDKVLVASKVRFRTGDGPNDAGLSRIHLIKACEASLKRLGTDHIDLYQLHKWDGQTPLEETLEALDSLVRSGKVRYVGVSNFSGWHLMKTIGVSELVKLIRPVSQQIHYTLQAREAEYELVPISIDQGLGILIWSPLAGGLLSGKYRRGYKPPEGTRQLANWGEPPIQDQEKLYDIIELLVAIAEGRGISAAQVALAGLIGRPGVTSVVIGARTNAQLQDNLKAGGIVLTAEERARLDAASAPALLYPTGTKQARPPIGSRQPIFRCLDRISNAEPKRRASVASLKLERVLARRSFLRSKEDSVAKPRCASSADDTAISTWCNRYGRVSFAVRTGLGANNGRTAGTRRS